MKRYSDKWLREKELRRLANKRDELWRQSRKAEYIPLEKPIFAGWDTVLYVNSERRDKKDLEEVISIMGWSTDFYVRDVKKIRELRRYGHTFMSYIKLRKSYHGYHNYISVRDYERKVPAHLNKYFEIRKSIHGDVYSLTWNFPFYAISVKIKKSYYYFRRVYDTVAQSEYTKLDDYLYYRHDLKTWGNSYRDKFLKSIRHNMNSSLKRIVKKQYTPDDILDDVNLFKGCFDKRDYGWN